MIFGSCDCGDVHVQEFTVHLVKNEKHLMPAVAPESSACKCR